MKRIVHTLVLAATLSGLAGARDPQTFTFYSWDRGRTYTITTMEVAVSLNFPGHWLYQPSVVLAGPETGWKRVLLFTSNYNAYQNGVNGEEAIFVSYDVNNTMQFPQPTAVLRQTQSTNICDMADARPIWDGSQWHVYVQALLRNGSQCQGPAVVVHAMGPSLTALSWDYVPGTQQARVVVQGNGSVGIGEDLQWFYMQGWANPFLGIYNDWGYGGSTLLAGTSSNGSTLNPWYTSSPAWSPYLDAQGYTSPVMYPDVLLSGSLDEWRFGPPGIGVQSSCYKWGPDAYKYQYSRVLGYFPNPTQPNALPGVANGEAVRSIFYDSAGERSFRPRFARDSRGFLPLSYWASNSRTWYTLAIYNPGQINNNSNASECDSYNRWTTSDQNFAFSHVWITEQ